MFCPFQEPYSNEYHIHLHHLAETIWQVANGSSFHLFDPKGPLVRIPKHDETDLIPILLFIWTSILPYTSQNSLPYVVSSDFPSIKISNSLLWILFSMFQERVSKGLKVPCCYSARLLYHKFLFSFDKISSVFKMSLDM